MITHFKATFAEELFYREPKENGFDNYTPLAPGIKNLFTFFTPVNRGLGFCHKLH
ncbi:hypothetical protein [Mucilaginibacter pocheonensis]|uniref:Uncharacterized protein n=1 Tax=Mucilaginibacter pocheonensis TaxID=398050 RepID=A0ABU1TIC4_9SPHI|nr:hypothetical protein [Mucilaginibacter pocheonensis]MDR6944996.1 hypothetical protein [Mucilaginibacter pocheonensis]